MTPVTSIPFSDRELIHAIKEKFAIHDKLAAIICEHAEREEVQLDPQRITKNVTVYNLVLDTYLQITGQLGELVPIFKPLSVENKL